MTCPKPLSVGASPSASPIFSPYTSRSRIPGRLWTTQTSTVIAFKRAGGIIEVVDKDAWQHLMELRNEQ